MHCNDDGSTGSHPTHDRLPPGGLRMHAVGLVAQADPHTRLLDAAWLQHESVAEYW